LLLISLEQREGIISLFGVLYSTKHHLLTYSVA
jgi:hypothetical protein